MKKILFLVFIFSFLYSDNQCYTEMNPAFSLLTKYFEIVDYPRTDPIGVYFCDSYTQIRKIDNCQDYSGSYKCVHNYYTYTNTYTCPDGQEIIDGVCAVPPYCDGIWDSNTDTCIPPPLDDLDDDNDGIPNKCDPDYADFSTMDCDGDGTPNSEDSDIDGDGILNDIDSTPYGSGSDGSANPDIPCPSTSYRTSIIKDKGQCSLSNPMLKPIDGYTSYISNVYWDECRQSCMIKELSCPRDQAIKDGQCRSVEPDINDCLGTTECKTNGLGLNGYMNCFKSCYCLTAQDPIPSMSNEYFYQEVSCDDNPSDKDKLDDLREENKDDKEEIIDPLKDSNSTANLNDSASFKAALDSYAGAKESTQKELLTESKIQSLQLVNANTNLKTLNSTLENFSAVATSNQGILNSSLQGIKGGIDTGNSYLGSIDDKMTTNNSLLEDIKGLLGDSNSSIDGDSNSSMSDYVESDSQSTDRNNIDGSLSQIYTFLNNVSNDYDNLKNMLNGGITAPNFSSGSTPSFCTNVFGRQLCINLCDSFGQFYSVFYYIFTALFLLASLKIYYLAFKMRS